MTMMHPYDRGFRLALRDIQAVIELLGHDDDLHHSCRAAIFMAADAISIELFHFKEVISLKSQFKLSANRKSSDSMRTMKWAVQKSYKRDATFKGYSAGFSRGKFIVSRHAEKMSFEPARTCILDVYQKLDGQLENLNENDYSSIFKLRKCRFVFN